MMNHNMSPERENRPEVDPTTSIEAVQDRNIVNGHLGNDFKTLVWLRNNRFLPEATDEREALWQKITPQPNGNLQYEDGVTIARTDRTPPDQPEIFSRDNLGESPIPGLGRMHSVQIKRITQFDPSKQRGIDSLLVTSEAEDATRKAIRRDFLMFSLQQDLANPGSMPKTSAAIGYDIWHGSGGKEYHVRDYNSPDALRDTEALLDVISVLTAELAMDVSPLSSSVSE